ncbi:MAG: Glu/Leu/Phe/Val dehydrogenase dimerization domain-containing protein [Candidatus Zixiibacteriota bacterium]
MEIFKSLVHGEHEQVVFWSDKVAGLRSIIAIHDTTLGPAIGGVRMHPYKSEDEALKDVLLLSESMTYKAAAAGINLGGGQAVIIGDPLEDKSELILRSFGRFVESLNGRYITAEDVGTTVEDMEIVRYETRYVTGLSRAVGGGGDPGPVTAIGLVHGLLACTEKVFGKKSLEGLSVAIQGLGNVGFNLAQELFDKKCKLLVADVDQTKANLAKNKFGAEVIPPDEIYDVDADILSPNALGGVINDRTIQRLKVKIVAGAANNQLEEDRHGDILHQRKILYAPDFVIGAGGLINVVNELEGYQQDRAVKQASGIYEILSRVLSKSEKENIPPHKAATLLAEERINQVKRFKQGTSEDCSCK